MKRLNDTTAGAEVIEASGPWPFVTRRVHRRADGSLVVWSSRHHRKGLAAPEVARAAALTETLRRGLWMPRKLNWWIGTIFALGSTLFAVASILSLASGLAANSGITPLGINAIYFAGSIPFTTAAYLQLLQAANAGRIPGDDSRSGRPFRLFGWRPRDSGWLSCASQFVGTILFNFNTFDAMIPRLTWFEQDLVIWAPNIFGSVLFLVSGYLAFIETCHAHWALRPGSISWWVVFVNLLGCLGFLVSAVYSIALPGPPDLEAAMMAVTCTLQGALCFLVGSLLMLPETAVAADG